MRTGIGRILSVALVLSALGGNAQVQVDPGISPNNYKHPNKAKKAQAAQQTVEVPTLEQVKKQEAESEGHKIVTPKYAKRPATLVVAQPSEESGVQVNPMKSPANYKAPKPAM